MRASDIMTTDLVCLDQGASVFDAAELLICAGVSALPVVDARGRIVGIVSEADLMRRSELGTAPHKSWLTRLLADSETTAQEFVRSHSRRVSEVMTTPVITAAEDTVLSDLVDLMEKHGVKRVPIVKDAAVVGIVSRANLLQALLSREPQDVADQASDEHLRRAVTAALESHGWTSKWPTNILANAGVVHLWGFVPGEDARRAYRVAAENVPGVKRVKSHLRPLPAAVRMGV
jgi:CBS domain-containing protein